jgi:hypothetical protein
MPGKARKSATAVAALPKVNPLSFARSAHRYPLDKRQEARQAPAMPKVRKTAAELDAIVRAEAARIIGPWPVGLRMLIFPLGDSWHATFGLQRSAVADYRDDVLPIVLRLRNEFDIIEL